MATTPAPGLDERRRSKRSTAAAAAALAAGLLIVLWTALGDSRTAFLTPHPPARWIIYPQEPQLNGRPAVEWRADFCKSFDLAAAPSSAIVELRAFRRARLVVNGRPVEPQGETPANWKSPIRYDLTARLKPGRNEICASVWNRFGPPALWLTLQAGETTILTDEMWESSLAGAAPRPSRLADDGVRRSDDLFPACEPWPRWSALAPPLLLFAVAAFLASLAMLRSTSRCWPSLAAACTLWVLLAVHNSPYLSLAYGFDATGHLDYVRYLLKNHRLPTASEGWEMFQPPFYYLLAAASLMRDPARFIESTSIADLRVVGWTAALLQISAVYLSLRLLFPGEKRRPIVGVFLAALLPAHLYLFQYVSNEGLAAALGSCGVYFALRFLQAASARWIWSTATGAALGLALWTKASALIPIGAVLLVQTGGLLDRRERNPREWLLRLVWPTALITLIAGWHYVGVWRQYGSPLAANWDEATGFSWRQDPGFHTPRSLLSFGRSLSEPYFAGVESFLDGLYSTLWLDGANGGSIEPTVRPPWNDALMRAGAWLALLPSLLILLGATRFLRRWIRRPSPTGALLLLTAGAALLAIVRMNLLLPYHSLAKGIFGLHAAIPLCVFAACGFDALARFRREAGWIAAAGLAIWGADSYAAYWIAPNAASTLRSQGNGLRILQASPAVQKPYFDAVQAMEPRSVQSWIDSASVAFAVGNNADAERMLRVALKLAPKDPSALVGAAILLSNAGRESEAAAKTREAIEAAPNYASARLLLGQLSAKQGKVDEAIAQYREALRIDPLEKSAHAALIDLYREKGDWRRRIDHLRYATLLEPSDETRRIALAWELATTPDENAASPLESLRWTQISLRNAALEPTRLDAQAAALARLGRFSQALHEANQAAQLAQAARQEDLVQQIQQRLELYRAGRPFLQHTAR